MLKTNGSPAEAERDSDLLLALQEPLVVIRLAAYALDAKRVLDTLEHQADHSESFEHTIRTVCPDWRNPGSTDDPADLITVALIQATQAMSALLWDVRQQ